MPAAGVLLHALNTNPPPAAPKPAVTVSAAEGDAIKLEGRVVAVLPGTMFRVQLANGHVVLAHISGKMRKHYVKIAAGDSVKLEMSPYDTDKARITFRNKEANPLPRPAFRRRY
ncbi:MAG: translation initiation factor IF-1 [Verrucomicrobia bacterium]|nr:translation initiation factor IF-1 [Verrucomicrobiota bacterium]